MKRSSARPADGVEEILEKYGDMLYRLCLVMLGNSHDAEDEIQETMLKYWRKKPEFRDADHEKAWFLRVTSNGCRDKLRYRKNHPTEDLETLVEIPKAVEDSGILEALMTLPEMYRIVLTLHYVEGYHTDEIAAMIGKTKSAVKMRLQKGRKLLEQAYRREWE